MDYPQRNAERPREAEFEELFRTHHKAVFGYAARRTDIASAHDVAAETFAVAWRRFDALPADMPLPWLYGIARRVLANALRSDRRLSALRCTLSEQPAMRLQEIEGTIGRALAALGENDRETLLLVAWEGLSAKEAADALGIPRPTFRVRYHRARRRLEQALDELEWRAPANQTSRKAELEVEP